jgi:Kef-type K+ transport system membrane component KefB
MWSILVFLVIGIVIGAALKFSERQKSQVSKLQQFGVVVLLFSMGLSIGLNRDILMNLRALGFQAFAYAGLTSLFSVAVVYGLSRLLVREVKSK